MPTALILQSSETDKHCFKYFIGINSLNLGNNTTILCRYFYQVSFTKDETDARVG